MLEVIRVAANGRLEVRCLRCLNYFWLTAAELKQWQHCPHCVRWTLFDGAANVRDDPG
jgi:hypothetical protein